MRRSGYHSENRTTRKHNALEISSSNLEFEIPPPLSLHLADTRLESPRRACPSRGIAARIRRRRIFKLWHQAKAQSICIFYPKFHCELNFIERYWCGAKWYARENCGYSLDACPSSIGFNINCINSPLL